MILSDGVLYESEKQDLILESLEDKINETLAEPFLLPETVISALDRLSYRIEKGEFDDIIASLDLPGVDDMKSRIICMLREDSLRFRMEMELGAGYNPDNIKKTNPPHDMKGLSVKRVPLGTIFHISAGNVDALPAYCVAEGLITGNVNILKLPSADNGLTIKILTALIEEEPRLKKYIHVFDTPSTDVHAMLKMASISDAVSVWGGEEAISAIRQMAPNGIRIIEWGHKLSFCYLSGDYRKKKEELEGLAKHIMLTNGLLCSSCQTIYIDTDKMEDINDFCAFFLPILEKATSNNSAKDFGGIAETSIRKRTEEIDAVLTGKSHRIFGDGCSLIPGEDSELVLSDLWGNVPVKPLPRENIIPVLRRKKHYLQTAGLISDDPSIKEILIKAGVTRVMSPANMSESFLGEGHDGTYSFARFTRIVDSDL